MAQGPDELRERSPQEEEEKGPPETTPAASEETKERARQGDEVAASRAEVEQTRAEMGETIDSLQEKLEPRKLKEQATTVARGTVSEILEAIRNNPKPVALGALALVGLLVLARGLPGQRRRGSSEVIFDLRRGKVRGT
jgi:CRISPR/Cas system-associated endonuclease Cas3-HD